MFRALILAALVVSPLALHAESPEEGFQVLFDGKNLDSWQGDKKGYEIKDGVLICKKDGGGNIYTKEEYADFEIRFEFKLTPNANNGLGIRTPMQGDPAYVGMEIQILDDGGSAYTGLKEYQYHGSVYGVQASKRGHQKPVGEWNSETVIAKGKQITVLLNGEKITDVDIEKASTPKTADGQNHPGLKNDKGYICFCGHGAEIEFRNIRIKPIK